MNLLCGRRRMLVKAVIAALLHAMPAAAEEWPARPMTMVVPFGAGGSSDVMARILAEGLREMLGQPVLVENVGGAGGMSGANRVAKAAPDGYQFVLGNVGTHAQNQSLYRKPHYHALADFTPVILVAFQSLVLVARKDFPADDFRAFVAYSKAHAATMQYGSAGTGGSNHLACILLNAAIGVDVAHVPYRSGGQAMQDLLAGRIDYQCPSAPVALPQISAHSVKALAILSKSRASFLPQLPSAHEQGLTGFDVPSWYALFLPKDTPLPIVAKLHDASVAVMDNPLLSARLMEVGAELVGPERRSPEYLHAFVAAEIAKWAVAIKASGVELN